MTGPILALEFAGLGPQAHFDAMTAVAGSASLIRLDPITGQRDRARTLDEQAQAIRRQLGETSPRLVLAHCTAAALALRLAALSGGSTHAVLFDPARTGLGELRTEFELLAGRLGAELSAGQHDAQPSGTVAAAEYCRQLADLRQPLVADYGGDAEAEDLVEQLLLRYSCWLRYLGSVVDAAPVANRFPVSTLVSADTEIDLAGLLTDPGGVEVHRLAVTAGALLTDAWSIDFVGKAAER